MITYETSLAAENDLVEELISFGWSQTRVLKLLSLPASSWHYRHKPRPKVEDPKPYEKRVWPNQLSEEEVTQVKESLASSGVSIRQTYWRDVDAGAAVASLSTYYRIARAMDQDFPRTRPASTGSGSHKRLDAPLLQAEYAGQVLCWDISMLPGPYTGRNFLLYTVIDLFSRFICAFTVQPVESAKIAIGLLEEAIKASPGKVEVVHADNGSAMRSKQLARMLHARGIKQSFIRPSVSNDNAYMESFFRTVKYGPSSSQDRKSVV